MQLRIKLSPADAIEVAIKRASYQVAVISGFSGDQQSGVVNRRVDRADFRD